MDRLTRRIGKTIEFVDGKGYANLSLADGQRLLFKRLADYEDCWLSPEQIIKAQSAMNAALAMACEIQAYRDAEAEGRLVKIHCFCKDCDFGYLDKEMSSPDRGWWYGCQENPNHYKRADGYCSTGVPRESTENTLRK